MNKELLSDENMIKKDINEASGFTYKFLSEKRPKVFGLMVSSLGFFISSVLLVIFYHSKIKNILTKKENEITMDYMLENAFYLLFAGCIFFFTFTILTLGRLFYSDYDNFTFLQVFVDYNWFLIVFVVAISGFLIIFTFFCVFHDIEDTDSNKILFFKTVISRLFNGIETPQSALQNLPEFLTVSEYFYYNIYRTISAISIFLLVILIKRAVTQYVGYSIHHKYFRDTIKENDKHIKYINKFVKKAKTYKKKQSNVDVAEDVFNMLLNPNNDGFLCIEDFYQHFGKEDGENMFYLFDEDKSNSVSKQEFIRSYKNLLEEQKKLSFTLKEKDKNIEKLESILSWFFLPIYILIFFTFLGKADGLLSIYKTFFAILISLSFVFSNVLSQMCDSLVCVFLIRPFDHGDFITIDNNEYTVENIGWFFSSFRQNGSFVYLSNSIFKVFPIINHRKSKFISRTFEQEYKYNSDLGMILELSNVIKTFLEKNSQMFKKELTFKDYVYSNKNVVRLKITIRFNIPYHNENSTKSREEFFLSFLHEAAEKLEMKQLTSDKNTS